MLPSKHGWQSGPGSLPGRSPRPAPAGRCGSPAVSSGEGCGSAHQESWGSRAVPPNRSLWSAACLRGGFATIGRMATDEGTVLLAEFSALRAEMGQRTSFQQALMGVNLTAIGTIAGLVVSSRAPTDLLLVIPVVSSTLGFALARSSPEHRSNCFVCEGRAMAVDSVVGVLRQPASTASIVVADFLGRHPVDVPCGRCGCSRPFR